jgi:3-oxosteroid 1-dehydrogenase
VDRPCGYENELSTPVESAFSTNRICTCPNRIPERSLKAIYVRDANAPEYAEPELIRARRGVILGCGGFEHNEQMRVKYHRAPITTEWMVGAKANTGDGIIAAEKLGAALGQGPGPENIPAWLVFDQRYRDRYIFARLQPGQRIPKKWPESCVIVTADTLAELAIKAGLPVDALTATVERFNGFARSGVDEDFHRGESAHDRYYGDPTNKPNPNLGDISHAPYYAAKMLPGDLGTKGGIRTDVHDRALRDDVR